MSFVLRSEWGMMMGKFPIESVITILREEMKKYKEPAVTEISRTRDPFKVLISTVLSLRTKDAVTREASKRLFERAGDPRSMLEIPIDELERLIYPVGFYKTKARKIHEICRLLLEHHDGRVPDELDELLKLPGVGRKTANLVITLGFNKLGICVDTHVHRISNRWGLVKTKTPEETEMALRKILPKEYWIEFNDLLVTFGQNTCKPISPFCSKCPIQSHCPKIGVNKHR